jgi:hypothetical protein
VAGLVAVFAVTATAFPGGRALAAGRQPLSLSVSVAADRPGAPVPAEFLGLSFELSSLPLVASYADHGDLVALLRSLGPGVLRFGGVSADTRVAWTDPGSPLPAWASGAVQPSDLRKLAVLAEETGWHVLLTLGLGHFEPVAAAREAAVAKAALGPWLAGVELGNEPNAWALHGIRAEPWTFVQYDEQVSAYRSAIEAAAPGIPLAGPDNSGSTAFENWGTAEVVDQRPALLTGHHYALNCAEQPPPTVVRLLSSRTQQLEQVSLARYMSVARASETPLRLDEINNVSCGGVAGVSNTFASALWAVGYLTEAMQAGAAGVNLHGNPSNCGGYAPLCAPTSEDLEAGALRAQPEWYALLLARALVGDRPIPALVTPPARVDLRLAAFLAADGALQLVVVDDDLPGARAVRLALHAGSAYGAASMLSLTGPAPAALAVARLGARRVGSDGSWSPPRRLPRAVSRHGLISISMTPSSATLVTVTARGTALQARSRG